jgi:integrase-like protein
MSTPEVHPRDSASLKPRLLDQVRDTIRRKHYSIRTEVTYIDCIKRYIFFHKKRHPQEMAAAEIERFLNHLAVEKRAAASTQNPALIALIFLYREALRIDLEWMKNLETRKETGAFAGGADRERVRWMRESGTTGVAAPTSAIATKDPNWASCSAP